jgi:hypothetical protein
MEGWLGWCLVKELKVGGNVGLCIVPDLVEPLVGKKVHFLMGVFVLAKHPRHLD